MAKTQIKATAQLFLDTSNAKSDAKKFVADLKEKLSSIETAADKMTVFKDLVGYIAQVDKALTALKTKNGDAFKHMFEGMDENFRKEFEALFSLSGKDFGKLTALREQLATLTPKSGVATIRKFATELNALFAAAGKEAPLNLDEFKNKATQEQIDKLTASLKDFDTVWEDVAAKVKQGFNFGGTGSGAGGGLASGIAKTSEEIKTEVGNLEEQMKKLKQLQQDINKTMASIGKFDEEGSVMDRGTQFSRDYVIKAIKEFKKINDAFQNFQGDTNSVGYANMLTQYLQKATEFKSMYEMLRKVGTDNYKLFSQLKDAKTRADGQETTVGDVMRNLAGDAEDALDSEGDLIKQFSSYQKQIEHQINGITSKIAELQKVSTQAGDVGIASKEQVEQNQKLVMSYEKLSTTIKEYIELSKKLAKIDSDKQEEEYKTLSGRQQKLTDDIFNLAGSNQTKQDKLGDVFDYLDENEITEADAIKKICNILQIEVLQSVNVAANAINEAESKMQSFLQLASTYAGMDYISKGDADNGIKQLEEMKTELIELSEQGKITSEDLEKINSAFDRAEVHLSAMDHEGHDGSGKYDHTYAAELYEEEEKNKVLQSENEDLRNRLAEVEANKSDDEIDDLARENGLLEQKRELLSEIAQEYGNTITQKARDRYEELSQKDMDDGLTSSQYDRMSELGEQIDEADESLERFAERYEKIILQLSNGKRVEILPDDAGLRKLYKLDDESYGRADEYNGQEIEDIIFVRKQEQEIVEQTNQELKEQLQTQEQINASAKAASVDTQAVEDSSNEAAQYQLLLETIERVKLAVDEKTAAFKEEAVVVNKTVSDEINSLNQLKSEINEIGVALDAAFTTDRKLNLPEVQTSAAAEAMHYVTDPQGRPVTMYRGIHGTYGGLVSNRYHGGTFSTDNLELAKEYAGVLGKVEKINLSMKNPFEVEGDGALWNQIDYIGESADKTSKKLYDLKIDLRYVNDELKKLEESVPDPKELDLINKGLIVETQRDRKIRERKEEQSRIQSEIDAIFADDSNPYGKKTTNEIVEIAKEKGYDGVIFKNIIDSATGQVKDLSNVMVTFTQDQIHYIETIGATFESAIDAFTKQFKYFTDNVDVTSDEVRNTIQEMIALKQRVDAGDIASDEYDKFVNENSIAKDVMQFAGRSKYDANFLQEALGGENMALSFFMEGLNGYLDNMRQELQKVAKAFGMEDIPLGQLLKTPHVADVQVEEAAKTEDTVSSGLQSIKQILEQIYGVLHGLTGIESDNKNSVKYTEPVADTPIGTAEFSETDLSVLNAILQTLQEISNYFSTNKQEEVIQAREVDDSAVNEQYALESTLQSVKTVLESISAALAGNESIAQLIDPLVVAVNELKDAIKSADEHGVDGNVDKPVSHEEKRVTDDNKASMDLSDEIKQYNGLLEIIELVRMAVDEKTAAFTKEGVEVNRVVLEEMAALDKLIGKLAEVKKAVEAKTQAFVAEGAAVKDAVVKETVAIASEKELTSSVKETTKGQKKQSKTYKNVNTKETENKKIQLDQMLGSLRSQFTKSGIDSLSDQLTDEQRNIIDQYAKMREVIKELQRTASTATEDQIKDAKGLYRALMQQFDAYIKQRDVVKETSKQNGKKGQIVSTAQDKYNAVANAAAGYVAEGSPVIVPKLEKYKADLQELIGLRNKLNSGETLDDSELKRFDELAASCNKYAQEIMTVVNNTKKLRESEKRDNKAEKGNILGIDVNDINARKQALMDFVKANYDAKEATFSFNGDATKLNFTVKNTDGTMSKMSASFDAARTSIVATSNSIQKASSVYSLFSNKVKELWVYYGSRLGVDEVIQQVRNGIQHVREINTALTELKKVTNETSVTYDAFLQKMSKTAGVVGSTVKDLTTMAAEWARLNI